MKCVNYQYFNVTLPMHLSNCIFLLWYKFCLELGTSPVTIQMLMQHCIFRCIHPQDWFAVIDLEDAYFMCRPFHTTDNCFGLHP